jgi:hypothetical protein
VGLDLRRAGYHLCMTEAAIPDDDGTIEITGAPGWRYLPFESRDEQVAVTVVREGDGCELHFVVPSVVQRGNELGQIAKIVIGAQERVDRSEGLGA